MKKWRSVRYRLGRPFENRSESPGNHQNQPPANCCARKIKLQHKNRCARSPFNSVDEPFLLKNFSSRDIFKFLARTGDSKRTDDSSQQNKADSSVAKSEENSWLLGILETEEEMEDQYIYYRPSSGKKVLVVDRKKNECFFLKWKTFNKLQRKGRELDPRYFDAKE